MISPDQHRENRQSAPIRSPSAPSVLRLSMAVSVRLRLLCRSPLTVVALVVALVPGVISAVMPRRPVVVVRLAGTVPVAVAVVAAAALNAIAPRVARVPMRRVPARGIAGSRRCRVVPAINALRGALCGNWSVAARRRGGGVSTVVPGHSGVSGRVR